MNKSYIQPLTNRFRYVMDDPHTGEVLFFLGYIIYLGKFVWASTMFPFPAIINKLCLLLSIMLIGLKIILFDRYRFSTLLGIAAIILCSCTAFFSTRYTNAIFWIFLVMGSKDLDMRKMLKIYLVVTGTIVFLAVCASLVGVIENLQYVHTDRGVRNSFGIIYVTDFAAYIFYLALIYFYLKGPELHWVHIIFLIAVSGIVYYFCKARVDCICMVLIALIFGTQIFFNHVQYGFSRVKRLWNILWNKLGVFSMPILALLSIVVTYRYNPENSIMKALDKLLSSRLALGKQGFDKYGISLFGQVIEMNGMGGATTVPEDYFFIDCSYINVLLRQGVIFLLIILLVYTLICYRNRQNIYLLFAIALVGINCIIAHHIIEVSYNPFAYAVLMCGMQGNEHQKVLDPIRE